MIEREQRMRLRRFLVALVAPGAPWFGHGRNGLGLLLSVLHVVGLVALLAVAVTRAVFLPGAILLWLCYQGSLAVAVGSNLPVPCPRTRALWSSCAVQGLAGLALVGYLCWRFALVPVASQAGQPMVRAEERLVVDCRPPEHLLQVGTLLVVECGPGGYHVVRLAGLPGERVGVQQGRLCRAGRCAPQGALAVAWSGQETLVRGAAEVLAGRTHVVLPPRPGDSLYQVAPVTVPDGMVAAVPDDRHTGGSLCAAGGLLYDRSRIVGVPCHVGYSARLSRIGIALR